uniref:DC-STAMP domain-containing protein 1 n=2 Tax=Schistocephalus solidus TaxID=70667 RepID=A0A0X3NJ52_SCHSO
MTISAKENFIRKQKEVSKRLQTIFKNVDASASKKETVQKAVDFGAKIEDSIRRQLTNTCMILHRTRTQQCNLVAIESCYQVQKLASIAARFPILIASWCSREVLKGTACPTQAALKKAIDECSRSGYNIGLRDGLGAQFAMAKNNLQDVQKAFKVKIGYEKVKTVASSTKARMHDSAMAVEKLAYLTMDATRVLFAFVMAASTLLRLLFVLLLVKAQTYISKYLLDVDFDNVYVEDVYEDIDARRKKEGRMYLLPLKAHERKAFFWHRRGYTPAELLRAIVTFMKYIALGIALTMMFAVDAYLYSMMVILDEASRAEVRLGAKARETDVNAAAVKILGDGFLAEALSGIVTSFKMLMDVDLQYRLSQCAPNIITSSANMRQYFLSVWAVLLLLALISGYLLRMRHHILGFFYPPAHRRRQVHLYNTMLVNRQRDLTTNRNMVIHHASMGRLQTLGQRTGKVTGLAELAPSMAAAAGLARATCILCHDRLAVKPDVMYLCPVDGCAICRQCQLRISNDRNFCIACVNRNEDDMDEALLQLVSQTSEMVWSKKKGSRKQSETSKAKKTV